VLLAAMSDVDPSESGLASGVVNTAFMMGGALGLAILASLAASRTSSRLADGAGRLAATTDGYHIAFLAGVGFALAAAVLGLTLLRAQLPAPAHAHEHLHGESHPPVPALDYE
jgi:MFS family permease